MKYIYFVQNMAGAQISVKLTIQQERPVSES